MAKFTLLWEVLGVPCSFTGLAAAGATATETGGETAEEAAGELTTEVAAVAGDTTAEAAAGVEGMWLVGWGFSPTGRSFPAKGRITS